MASKPLVAPSASARSRRSRAPAPSRRSASWAPAAAARSRRPRPGRGSTRCRRAGRRRPRRRGRSPSTRAWTPSGRRAGRLEQGDGGALGGQLAQRALVADPLPPLRGPRSSSARTWRTSAPWPAAGVIVSAGIAKADLVLAPEPAQAGGGEDDRVELALGELAQPGVDVAVQLLDPRSGRAASSWARRRRLAVPTRAPSGTSSSEAPAPIQASAGSSRAGTAAIASPSGISRRQVLGRVDADLGLAVEQRPLDPAHEAGLVAAAPRREETSTSSAPPSSSATWLAWASASALPRVAMRSVALRSRRPRSLTCGARFALRVLDLLGYAALPDRRVRHARPGASPSGSVSASSPNSSRRALT